MEEKNFEILMNLIEKGDFSLLRHELSEMNEVDIAEFIQELPEDKLIQAFRLLPKEVASDVFVNITKSGSESIDGISFKSLYEIEKA